jgi:hypothetical protein
MNDLTNSPTLVLPLCCFPPIVWLKLAQTNGSVIDIHEHYVKQTYRNRYDISGVNGMIQLTVPVIGQKGQKTPFHQIQIAGHDWRKLHVRSIRSSYGRAAYFEHYIDDIERILLQKQTFLCDLNSEILRWISTTGLTIRSAISESHISNSDKDYRQHFEPTTTWPKQPIYPQVFSDRNEFQSNLSILDLLMNKGPQAADYLRDCII